MTPEDKMQALTHWVQRLEARARLLSRLLVASILLSAAIAATFIRYGDRMGLSVAAKNISAESVDAKSLRTSRIEIAGEDKTWYDGSFSLAVDEIKRDGVRARAGLVVYEGAAPDARRPIAILGRDAYGLPGMTVLSWGGAIDINSDERKRKWEDYKALEARIAGQQEQSNKQIADLNSALLDLRLELNRLRTKVGVAAP